MHIVLGALGAIITILILLNRLSDAGIDIGWLNPFAWQRRRDWAKKYNANPVYALKSPMEVTALLMVALAKSEGDISAEQKNEIKRKFRDVFHLDDQQATALFASSVFLLKEDMESVKRVDRVLAPSLEDFSTEQAASAMNLVTHIANFDSPANAFQEEVIGSLRTVFQNRFTPAGKWS